MKAEFNRLGIHVQTKERADEALGMIATFKDRVEKIEIEERAIIHTAEAHMIAATVELRGLIAANEENVEAWAKANAKEIFPEGKKSLELTRGTIGFRLPKSKIKLVLAVENIVARLKAKKLFECIRVIEEPDLLQLTNYDDEQLEAVGLKRTNPKDKFFYELKKTEVK